MPPPDDIAAITHLPRSEETVNAATAAEIEYGFAGFQAGDADRITTAEGNIGDIGGKPL
jgi:hypothetical protein